MKDIPNERLRKGQHCPDHCSPLAIDIPSADRHGGQQMTARPIHVRTRIRRHFQRRGATGLLVASLALAGCQPSSPLPPAPTTATIPPPAADQPPSPARAGWDGEYAGVGHLLV